MPRIGRGFGDGDDIYHELWRGQKKTRQEECGGQGGVEYCDRSGQL